jgi:hypothetical protein
MRASGARCRAAALPLRAERDYPIGKGSNKTHTHTHTHTGQEFSRSAALHFFLRCWVWRKTPAVQVLKKIWEVNNSGSLANVFTNELPHVGGELGVASQ